MFCCPIDVGGPPNPACPGGLWKAPCPGGGGPGYLGCCPGPGGGIPPGLGGKLPPGCCRGPFIGIPGIGLGCGGYPKIKKNKLTSEIYANYKLKISITQHSNSKYSTSMNHTVLQLLLFHLRI